VRKNLAIGTYTCCQPTVPSIPTFPTLPTITTVTPTNKLMAIVAGL